jgi:hypothetical protein
MPIISLKSGTKSRSLLVGNPYFVPSSYESIATATGTGSSNTITLSSIPTTYKHLQLRIFETATLGAGAGTLSLRVNGDTGSNYARHQLTGNGSSADAAGTASTTSITLSTISPDSANNIGSVAIIDIHDYASTTKNKTIRTFSGCDRNGLGQVFLGSGVWLSTTAINSLTVFLTSTSLATTSTFALYGIKG